MITKLRAPTGMSSFSHEGRSVEIAKDGSLQVPTRDVAAFKQHGFIDWSDEPGSGGDIETMTREQLVEAMIFHSRENITAASDEDLRKGIRMARGEHDDLQVKTGTGSDVVPPVVLTEADVSGMSRKDMFAFLQERGVAIGPATKDDGLRAAVVNELRKTA